MLYPVYINRLLFCFQGITYEIQIAFPKPCLVHVWFCCVRVCADKSLFVDLRVSVWMSVYECIVNVSSIAVGDDDDGDSSCGSGVIV